MRIDRCVCFDRTFADLLERARESGIEDVDRLREAEPFGLKCGLCVPYMRAALRTGETVFRHLLTDDPVEYRE